MRRKLEQQRIFDQERKAQKLAKAKEIFRLQKAQSSALEMQAMQDEINAQRVQEEVILLNFNRYFKLVLNKKLIMIIIPL